MPMRSDPCTDEEASAVYALATGGGLADQSGANNRTFFTVPPGRVEPVVPRIPKGAFGAYDVPANPSGIEPMLLSPLEIWRAVSRRSPYVPNLLYTHRDPDFMIVAGVVDDAGNPAPTLGSLDPARNPALRARLTVDMPRIFGSFDGMVRGDFADGRPPLVTPRDDVAAFLDKRNEWISKQTKWWEDPDIGVLCEAFGVERDLVAPEGRRETGFAPTDFGYAHVSLHEGNVLVPPDQTWAIDIDRGVWAPPGFNMAAHLRSVVYQYEPDEVAAMWDNYGNELDRETRAAMAVNYPRIKDAEVSRECAAYVWDVARMSRWSREGRPVSQEHWNLRMMQLHGSVNNVNAYVTGAPRREYGELAEIAEYAARSGVQALRPRHTGVRRQLVAVPVEVPAEAANPAVSSAKVVRTRVGGTIVNTSAILPFARPIPHGLRPVSAIPGARPLSDLPAQHDRPATGYQTAAKAALEKTLACEP
ncbi:MAG: hypothetical protein HOV68_30170 [Streptomycetaceae bacterium]|nr:hypothetical protein [Streptomycetaceae bacterium]